METHPEIIAHCRHQPLQTMLILLAATVMPLLAGAQLPPEEVQVLHNLYNMTDGDNWDIKDGWMGPPGTECDWYGIVCDSDGSHIVRLLLHHNNLSGEIPNLDPLEDRKSTRLNSSHVAISYAVFCLKKK